MSPLLLTCPHHLRITPAEKSINLLVQITFIAHLHTTLFLEVLIEKCVQEEGCPDVCVIQTGYGKLQPDIGIVSIDKSELCIVYFRIIGSRGPEVVVNDVGVLLEGQTNQAQCMFEVKSWHRTSST